MTYQYIDLTRVVFCTYYFAQISKNAVLQISQTHVKVCGAFLTKHGLAHNWFLKIDLVRIVSMHVRVCVCPRPRLLITSGMMWRDMNLIQLVK